jgi:ABC-2 type transport system ATP-binding protein
MKSGHLSGGYQKKASLACAFIGDPDVIIIDEPTLGLDIRFKNILHRKLRTWKEHKLIILGTSDQTEA